MSNGCKYSRQVPPSTFTRRPVQKTEHEQRIEQAQADRLVRHVTAYVTAVTFD